jgi:outer membrane protein assembly factor BamB
LPIANGKDLGQLNRTTGQEILIAASNFSGTDLFAMEIDTRTGTLYAVDYTSRQFFTVNLTTGTATPFGNLSFLQPIGGRFFNDLAFAPDGTLWAAIGKAVQGVGSGDLYTIDLQTGQANWETVPET